MLDGRLMVQWRRNSNNSMDKTPWAAFMESKDKFHNLEFVSPLKMKSRADSAINRRERREKARSRGPRFRLAASSERRRPRLPCPINIGDDLRRCAHLQARFRRPILSDKPNPALVEERP
jgi:hypothetical protein